MTAPVGSTAVAPYFRRGDLYTYRCRECGWLYVGLVDSTRDQRMIALAHHLADAHQTGPLAKVTA